MTDKEQIIIDGVDVSRCEWFKDGMCYAECDLEGYTDWECKDAELSNCYFKQLARKTEEYEKYKQALDEVEKVCIEYTHEFTDGATVHYFSLDEILDIINKVKDEQL